jgi:uncharacterized protein
MDFVWHGGEPLLLGADFYKTIAELQHEIFDPLNIAYSNSVQTNLTKLTRETIALLRDNFSSVGVSIDLFGDQRVNINGKLVQEQVIKNMQRLLDENIRFGCITVLSQATAPHIEDIYNFFQNIDISFRMLPIYRTGYAGQQDDLALTPMEIVDTYKKAIDIWFSSDTNIQVRPIQDYIVNVVRHIDRDTLKPRIYSKSDGEVVFIVDTDGSLFSNGDAYDPSLCHGNIFRESLFSLKCSEGYRKALAESNDRMSQACSECRYHGACSGYFMAESTPEQRNYDATGRLKCSIAKPTQEYIEQFLLDSGIANPAGGFFDVDRVQQFLTADSSSYKFEG